MLEFITVLFTLVNVPRIIHKQDIPAMNMISWAVGIVGILFVYKIIYPNSLPLTP